MATTSTTTTTTNNNVPRRRDEETESLLAIFQEKLVKVQEEISAFQEAAFLQPELQRNLYQGERTRACLVHHKLDLLHIVVFLMSNSVRDGISDHPMLSIRQRELIILEWDWERLKKRRQEEYDRMLEEQRIEATKELAAIDLHLQEMSAFFDVTILASLQKKRDDFANTISTYGKKYSDAFANTISNLGKKKGVGANGGDTPSKKAKTSSDDTEE